jgi:NAD-dependent deacetylase
MSGQAGSEGGAIDPTLVATLDRVALRLCDATRLLFITGAGMSRDSGLPTYRGVGGLYENMTTVDGVSIEDALSGEMMKRNPALTWRYIAEVEAACRGASPNVGHHAIAALERRFEVWVLTQNVDGLHRAAGSTHIIDIHGDVRALMCTRCDYRHTVGDYGEITIVPRCPHCDGLVRPRVVLFGEALPEDQLALLHEQVGLGFDAVFSVGTSSLFPYIAQPVLVARQRGALTVEINPDRTVLSDAVDERFASGASSVLHALSSRFAAPAPP